MASRNSDERIKYLVEFVEIDRRQFFRIAGGALIALSPLSVISCGGKGTGSGGFSNTGSTGGGLSGTGSVASLRGVVQLPAGSGLTFSGLTVGNGMGQQTVGSNGTFAVQAHTNGPSLAVATVASGKGVLLGYMDPTATSTTISVQSTAVALLCTSLGISNMPDQVKAEVVTYLNSHPDLAPLVTTLTARIAANPTAINDGDVLVTQALTSAMTAISGTVSAQSVSKSIQPLDGGNTQMLLDPAGQVSGLQLAQTSTPGAFIATNNWRTPCRLFLYEIATTNMATPPVTTQLSPAKLIGQPIDLDGKAAILQVNVVQTAQSIISGYFDGTAPLVPVSTSPITVTLEPNTSKTQYALVVVFASVNANVPSFFADPVYLPYTSKWQTAQGDLNLYTFFTKLTFGLLLDVFGVSYTYANFTDLLASAQAAATISDATWAAMVTSVRSGAFGAYVKTCFERAVENGGTGFVSTSIQKALAPLAQIAQQRAMLEAGAAKAAAWSAALKMVLGAGTLLVGLGDLSATLIDLNNSDYADLWNVTMIEPAVHLSPASPTVSTVQTPQQFTATAPTGTTGTIVWDWSVTAPVAQVTDQGGHQGQSIETSSSAVYLLVTPSDLGTITLTVEGFVVVGGVKTSIGKTSTVVTVVDHVIGSAVATMSVVTFAQEPNGVDTYALAIMEFPIDPNGAVFELYITGEPYSAMVTAEQIGKGGYTTLDPSKPLSAATSANIPGSSFYSLGTNKVGLAVLAGDLAWYTIAYFKNYVQQKFDPTTYTLVTDPSNVQPSLVAQLPAMKTVPKP